MATLSRAIRNARAMLRAQEWGDSSIPPPGANGSWTTGGAMNTEAAALGISTVLSCVKALYDDMTSLPFLAYTGDRNGPRKVLGEQPEIVTNPFGPECEIHTGIGQLVVSKAMRGNSYLFVVQRDAQNFPSLLWPLHPDSVHPFWRGGTKRFKVGGEEFGTDQIIQMQGLTMPGAAEAVDILTAQRINFGLASQVTEYGSGFFGNGGSPSGVIEVPGQGDRRKAREVKEGWEEQHAGVANAHRPAVVFGGAKWVPMSVTPENAQFLGTRAFLREEICGFFGVPLQRIQAISDNASQGGGKGLDAIDAGYVKHTLLPIATGLERVWSTFIPGGQRTWALFDFDSFLRANAETRASVRQINRVTAVRTIDEERADEGWAPLPDGQGANPFTPLNSNASPTGGVDNAPAPGNGGSAQ